MTLANPPSAPPMRNVEPITRFTSMPISAAAVGFCATARMAFPRRVDFTNHVKPIINGTVTITTNKSRHVTVMADCAPNKFSLEMSDGKSFGAAA